VNTQIRELIHRLARETHSGDIAEYTANSFASATSSMTRPSGGSYAPTALARRHAT